MIHNLIKTDDYLLAVSEGEIQERDFYIHQSNKVTQIVQAVGLIGFHDTVKPFCKKITHYYPLSDKTLDLPLLQDPNIENTIKILAANHFPIEEEKNGDIEYLSALARLRAGYYHGYCAALKDHNITIYPKQWDDDKKEYIF